MSIELTTLPERNAQKAEKLAAFGSLNLLHIKKSVASLLGLIGREAIFDQYTKHDITHIDEMLRNLEWIIPDSSKPAMSDSDWLMIVLAVYFHDMGMLVTKAEFEARATAGSGFPAFCEQVLFGGANGPDYKAKVEQLSGEEKDRFLYQEFVRHKHAERIRAWIMGQAKEQLGLAQTAVTEVSKLLEPVGQQFRRDLGIVCESHHLNDLGDVQKYKVSQPYGNSDAETVNLQYCAVLLRTADLLHMTSDRTPSIEFRTINPTDPISQQEWARQMAVKRVRPKWGLNEEGQADEKALRDTVEVYAYFTKEDGFFGLTSYLGYAAEQLKKSNEWISNSAKLRLAKHEFPWRRIDDTNIETEGFIRDAFEFTIDQAKILDLLTGHTLYNDTNVVLRELAQNAIDAIRLKHFPASPKSKGKVAITWNSQTRILAVQDNGTGMTQDIINNFLLKVGSSRYQDPEFIKKNPGFSSISRFGIGVLSTFMIADSVEIISCHPDEEQARRLTLRSVHGKYLIRLLDKGSGDPKAIGPHGTIFRLRVRPSVEMADVLKTAQQWIVVPECKVTAQIDGAEEQTIGFESPAGALRAFIRESGLDYCEETDDNSDPSLRRIRIVERSQDGVDLAYALSWDRWFKEWSFLKVDSVWNRGRLSRNEKERPLLGTCVEGIRIVTETPGFERYPIVALANVRGQAAPKTNVARSGLEVTPERDAMLRVVYKLYAEHITNELSELTSKRSFSPTWAVGETVFLLAPLMGGPQGDPSALNPKLLQEALSTIPCVMVEETGKRFARSPKELLITKELWTIDCGLLSSAESLIREVASAASLSGLVNALNVADFKFPDAPVVCGATHNSEILHSVFARKEVDRILVNPTQRRVDLRWVDKTKPSRWAALPLEQYRLASHLLSESRKRIGTGRGEMPLVPADGVEATVPDKEIAVRAFGALYLTPGTDVANFARRCIDAVVVEPSNDNLMVAVAVLCLISEHLSIGRGPTDVDAFRKALRSYDMLAGHLQLQSRIEEAFDFTSFTAIAISTNWKSFDTWAWRRVKGGPEFEFD
jgi:molecular chaperone HtpG